MRLPRKVRSSSTWPENVNVRYILTSLYYVFSDSTHDFIAKEVSQDWNARLEIYKRIGSSSPFVRDLVDTVPERKLLIFDHLQTNLLQLAAQEQKVPQSIMRYILKCTLCGIAALHEKDIIHNGKKTPSENNPRVEVSF
jgi:serine/threonine protein kinase